VFFLPINWQKPFFSQSANVYSTFKVFSGNEVLYKFTFYVTLRYAIFLMFKRRRSYLSPLNVAFECQFRNFSDNDFHIKVWKHVIPSKMPVHFDPAITGEIQKKA